MSHRIEIIYAEITTLDVDAIVNAANAMLLPGGGVCGAIHRGAGPELAQACRTVGACPTGSARITPGFRLKARHVIHAVGPVWNGGSEGEDEQLAGAYSASLALADAHELNSIAFPAISTGIYGFPADRAAVIAVRTIHRHLSVWSHLRRVMLCCFGVDSVKRHQLALKSLENGL